MTKSLPSTRYSFYVLFVILLVYITNQWDRYLLPYLSPSGELDPFKNVQKGLNLSGWQYGLLTSYGFSFLYVICGLFAGRLADKMSRKYVLLFGLVGWSLSTAATGLAQNFTDILFARISLGVFESACAPTAYSMISDYFPKEKRGQANSIYSFGIYVGGALASLSVLLDSYLGWRVTFMWVGATGLAISVLFFLTVKEPVRAQFDEPTALPQIASSEPTQQSYTFMESVTYIARIPASWTLVVAASLRFFGGYALGAYLSIYFSTCYPSSYNLYGILNSFVVSLGGLGSSYLGGYFSDRWEKTEPSAKMFIPAIGAMCSIPFVLGTLLIDSFAVNIVCLFFAYLTAECWGGPAMAAYHSMLPATMRGTATAIYLLIGTIVGSSSPVLLGVVQDAYNLAKKPEIRYPLAAFVVFSYVTCSIFFYISGRSFRSGKEKDSLKKPLLSDNGLSEKAK